MEAAMKRSKSTLTAVLLLAGAAGILSACAADPDYESSQFAYGYPTYGYFDYDYWGGDWHRHWDHDHWRR
jgi:hypothetical protein